MSFPSTPLAPVIGTPFTAPLSEDLLPYLTLATFVVGLTFTGAFTVTRAGLATELALAIGASAALGFAIVFAFLYSGVYV